MFCCKRGHTSGSNIAKKLFWCNDFVIITKAISKEMLTMLFKIITRMKLLLSVYLGDYSYSFQWSSELISITVRVSFLAECSYRT